MTKNLGTNLVLSLKQPHAQNLVTPGKEPRFPVKWIENRSWQPGKLEASTFPEDEGLPRILIHASKTADTSGGTSPNEMWDSHFVEGYEKSAIIGSVRLVGVIQCKEAIKLARKADIPIGKRNSGTFEEDVFELCQSMACSYSMGVDFFKYDKPLGSNESFPVGGIHHIDMSNDTYWWFVDRPILFDEPIRNVKGKLNIWRYK